MMRVPVMRSACAVLLAAWSVLAVGCASPGLQPKEQLLQTDREWATAAGAGDVDQLLRYWADDATNFFPGRPVAQGKQAIRALVDLNRSQPGFALTWEPVHAAVAASGDLGYTWGTFRLTKQAADGEQATRSGHYVAIWRRQDGHWQCEVESTIFTD